MNANDALRWLAFALSDINAARKLLSEPDYYPRQVCFLAQQSAEKALKAIYVFNEKDFPYTHDLDRLRETIPPGWRVKQQFPQLYALSNWAVESRYPGELPEVVFNDAYEAIELAEAIYQSVSSDIQSILNSE
jgi:HEPN domain-containing protein